MLTTTDEEVARRSYAILGLGRIYAYPAGYTRGVGKAVWLHGISAAAEVYATCALLFPFMSYRRQARIIELVQCFKDKQ